MFFNKALVTLATYTSVALAQSVFYCVDANFAGDCHLSPAITGTNVCHNLEGNVAEFNDQILYLHLVLTKGLSASCSETSIATLIKASSLSSGPGLVICRSMAGTMLLVPIYVTLLLGPNEEDLVVGAWPGLAVNELEMQ
ncbi:hypothetical protein BDN72DRAFT_73863 [Pluteus cervinus]|uniref:Uncharacterized protein n=1 Tax=Pluteus cervinus TaxID=181527 RepID=A0ACD3AQ70_9AGAR|nr:hypothetical protein BDN72DRAFT_73863 [Pluteus cervinus]